MLSDQELLDIIVRCDKGSVIAPAGCGKTEQIARAALHGRNRRLILTHTLAGVDALRNRLRSKGAHSGEHEVTTIASWSLRLASSFPMRSELSITMPNGDEWDSVYTAAERLITAGCIRSLLISSYCGLFVDEYQDCTQLQHKLIRALASILPCCVFGDHLQAIFGFRANSMPDWNRDVLQDFPKVAELSHPYRWHKVANGPLGDWLLNCRDQLENEGRVNLQGAPSTVHHRKLRATDANQRYQEIAKFVRQALDDGRKGTCIVIGDSRNENARAILARSVAATAIEPVDCKKLTNFVTQLEASAGFPRLKLVLQFVKAIMTKANAAALEKAAKNIKSGTRRKAPNELEQACVEITCSQSLIPILDLLQRIPVQNGGQLYRRELHYSLCGALRDVTCGLRPTLADAVWEIQNRRRHSGRRFGKRNIGSTLLVKGLEFDHTIIVQVETLKRNDLYVALTRGSRTITVISESTILRPGSP
jgi:DNA helicase-2/ATP-dependent DNA helicase PcrA